MTVCFQLIRELKTRLLIYVHRVTEQQVHYFHDFSSTFVRGCRFYDVIKI